MNGVSGTPESLELIEYIRPDWRSGESVREVDNVGFRTRPDHNHFGSDPGDDPAQIEVNGFDTRISSEPCDRLGDMGRVGLVSAADDAPRPRIDSHHDYLRNRR
jgi:hypothetical protein